MFSYVAMTCVLVGGVVVIAGIENLRELPGRLGKKWGALLCVLGVLFVGLGAYLFLAVAMPRQDEEKHNEKLAEAERITRKTFREKLGREPDSLTLESAIRRTNDRGGWERRGTATLNGQSWDVLVTWTDAGTEHVLRCWLTPGIRPSATAPSSP